MMSLAPCLLLLIALSCVEGISPPTKWSPVTSVPDGLLEYVISSQDTFLLMVGWDSSTAFTSTTGSDWVQSTFPNSTIVYSTFSEELGQVLSLFLNDVTLEGYLCYGPIDDLSKKCIGNSIGLIPPDLSDGIFYIAYGNGMFMVSYWDGGGSGTVLSMHENATTWTPSLELDPLVIDPPNSSYTFYLNFGGVVYSNKIFYVTSGNGFFQSTDGQQWNFINMTGYMVVLLVANNNLYGIDLGGYLYHFNPASNEWTHILKEPVSSAVHYNSGLYFVIGDSGSFYYSKDGLDFTLGSHIADYYVVSCTYANGLYLAVAQNITVNSALTYLYQAQG